MEVFEAVATIASAKIANQITESEARLATLYALIFDATLEDNMFAIYVGAMAQAA